MEREGVMIDDLVDRYLKRYVANYVWDGMPDDMPEGTFDIVVANILANPLKILAPALLGRVKPHGTLVLSGVLAAQADDVIAAYRAVDPSVPLAVWRQEGDWVCIAGRRA